MFKRILSFLGKKSPKFSRARFESELGYLIKIQWGEVDKYYQWIDEWFQQKVFDRVWIRRANRQTFQTHFETIDHHCMYLEDFLETLDAREYLKNETKRLMGSIREVPVASYYVSTSGKWISPNVAYERLKDLTRKAHTRLQQEASIETSEAALEYYFRFFRHAEASERNLAIAMVRLQLMED